MVLLTETWLDSSVADSELFNTAEYIGFRRDRGGRGGVVLAASPLSRRVFRRTDLEHKDLEALFLELCFPRGVVLVCCVYCPPSSREASYRLLDASLRAASKKNYSDTLIFGDFNAHVDWIGREDPIPRDQSDDILLDIVSSAGLTQACLSPTYTTHEGATSFLGLLFVADLTINISSLADTEVKRLKR